MAGTIPVPTNLSMQDLAATLTREEQLTFSQLTALRGDQASNPPRNLAMFINSPNQLGQLNLCAAGEVSDGTKVLSTQAYVKAVLTKIDVYRLPSEG